MKQIFTILFILSFAVCKSQSSINVPNDSIGFSIRVKDSRFRETGYFKYNHLTNRLTVRGNQNKVWGLFTPWLKKMYEIYNAQQAVFEQMNVDGSIKDCELFDAAMAKYMAVKRKYGM